MAAIENAAAKAVDIFLKAATPNQYGVLGGFEPSCRLDGFVRHQTGRGTAVALKTLTLRYAEALNPSRPRRHKMLVADLLHSCANDRVAEAAVSSIGGDFSSHMRDEAVRRGVSVGYLASSLVRNFARAASERDWRELSEATQGEDTPVLAGLQVILTRQTVRLREDARPLARAAAASLAKATSYARASGF